MIDRNWASKVPAVMVQPVRKAQLASLCHSYEAVVVQSFRRLSVGDAEAAVMPDCQPVRGRLGAGIIAHRSRA